MGLTAYSEFWRCSGFLEMCHSPEVCDEGYCAAALHYDDIFFEMQHSTMTWAEIEKMISACPRAGVPVIRLPNELEDTVQKATDWADYRMNWNGPSFDGWTPKTRSTP